MSASGNGAASGNTLYDYAVTNIGATSCTLTGFFGMEPFNGAGSIIPISLLRDSASSHGTVTLPPKGHGTLVFSAGGSIAGTCQVAATLHVTPPDETRFLTIAAGGFTVCGNGTVFVEQVTVP